MIKTVEKNGLKIVMDTEKLEKRKMSLLADIENGEFAKLVTKKNLAITETDYEDAVERLYQLAYEIFDEKKREAGFDIFEYLPLTKAGRFHKTNSILLATSGIKDVYKEDINGLNVVSVSTLSLYICPYRFDANNWWMKESDGVTAYLALGFYEISDKDTPVFNGNNQPVKVEKKRNTYIKEQDLIRGHVYKDAKGTKYFYFGHYVSRCIWLGKNETDYKQTSEYADVTQNLKTTPGDYYFVRCTNKFEQFLKDENVKTIHDLWKIYYSYKYGSAFNFKEYMKRPNYVEDCYELLIDDMPDEYVDDTMNHYIWKK